MTAKLAAKQYRDPAHPGARTLAWQVDYEAQEMVRDNGPMTLDAIGEYMGLSREAVRLDQESALAKIRRSMAREGADIETSLMRVRRQSELRSTAADKEFIGDRLVRIMMESGAPKRVLAAELGVGVSSVLRAFRRIRGASE